MADILGPSVEQLDNWGTLDSLDSIGTLEYLDNINLFEVAAAESIAITGTATAGRKVSFAASVTGAFSVAANGAFYKAGFSGSASISITATAVAATTVVDFVGSADLAITSTGEVKPKFVFGASESIAITGTSGLNYKAAYDGSGEMTVTATVEAEEMGEAWTELIPATAVFQSRIVGTDRWLTQ